MTSIGHLVSEKNICLYMMMAVQYEDNIWSMEIDEGHTKCGNTWRSHKAWK